MDNQTEALRTRLLEMLESAMREYAIPPYMKDGIRNYVAHGIPPGGFLTAVLENNFMESAARADITNQKLLWNYAGILYNGIPKRAQGSPEKVSAWIGHKGLDGMEENNVPNN